MGDLDRWCALRVLVRCPNLYCMLSSPAPVAEGSRARSCIHCWLPSPQLPVAGCRAHRRRLLCAGCSLLCARP